MKKFFFALLILAGMLTAANVCLAEETEQEFEWVEVTESYSPFVYSDSLLMVDENQLDPDIAKISAALSWGAYQHDQSKTVLKQMGYDVLLQSNYGYSLTREDCHHVAYNVARRSADDYVIYCVTVRGTTLDLEWFSNFKIDTVTDDGITYYRPFRDASKEIENDLLNLFAEDGYSADKRIIWLTGHSRGGAVANIIAGRMTAGGYGKVFGYNFASPAVYLGNAPAYKNIYNFNFTNDFVPRMPLTAWGYTRYGEDRTEDCSKWFDSMVLSTEAVDAVVGFLASIEPDSEMAKTLFAILDCYLSGELGDAAMSSLDVEKLQATFERYELDPDGLCQMVKDGIYSEEESDRFKKDCQTMIEYWNEYRETLASLPQDEWNDYRSSFENADVFALYDDVSGKTVSSYDELESIIPTVISRNDAANMVDSLKTVLDYIFDEDWEFKGLGVPHMSNNYARWMNEKYFGHRGMAGRSFEDVILLIDTKTISPQCFASTSGNFDVILDNVQGIGSEAFTHCSGLHTVELSDTQKLIGRRAFYKNENLKTVTIPCDIYYQDFLEECPVETVIYTPGKTGVVPDRTTNNMATDWMLEYDVRNTLKTLIFEEGITHIGSDLLYYDGRFISGSGHSTSPAICGGYLENVTLPSTLKSIGDRSFMGCAILNRIELPEGLESIGKSSFASCGLVEINFPSTLPAIADGAFANCNLLTDVVIPDTIESVGSNAFTDCKSIWKLTMPASATYNDSFEGCSAVETIVYTPGSTGVITDRTKIVDYSGKWYISSHMPELDVKGSLKEIIFEEGITHIGAYLCCNQAYTAQGAKTESCTKLERISLPSTLKSIGSYSFNGCSALNSINNTNVFPIAMENIGEYGFGGCTALPDITLPNSISSMGQYCFSGCMSMNFVNIPTSLESIPDNAFSGSGLMEIAIPENITGVGYKAFGDCWNLKKVTLSANTSSYNDSFEGSPVETIFYAPGSTGVITDRTKIVDYSGKWYTSSHMPELDVSGSLKEIIFDEGITHIGAYLCCNQAYTAQGDKMESCTVLERISLPSTLKSIGSYSFNGCTALNDVNLPDGLTSIGEYAFQGCNSLSGVVLPDTLESIGSYSFASSAIQFSVSLPSALQSIPNYAFYGAGELTEVIIPDNVTSVGYKAFGDCPNLKKVTLSANTSSYNDSFEGSPVETIVYTPGSTGVIANRTEKDPGYGLYTSSKMPELDVSGSLKEIIFEEGVTHIGDYLCVNKRYRGYYYYESCTKLERISLPSTLKSIGMYCFYGCSALNSVSFPVGLESIGEYCFNGCSALTDIALPDSITGIGKYSFSGCRGITSANIPTSLVEIQSNVFSGTGLTEVTIPDNITSVGYKAFGDCSNLKKVTLSANTSSYNDSFEGSPVETIVYTPGSTGVIANRTEKDPGYGLYTSSKMPELDVSGSLKEIIFEEGITHIGDYLCVNKRYRGYYYYESCTKLERISLPSTLRSIGKYAFAYCNQLTDITFLNVVDTTVTFYEKSFFVDDWLTTYVRVPEYTNINPSIAAYNWAGNGRDAVFTIIIDRPFEIAGETDGICIEVPAAFKVTGIPDGYSEDELIWRVNDENVARITQEGELTFSRAGYITISVMLPDTGLQDELKLECVGTKVIRLPATLTLLEQEAFTGMSAEIVIIPATVERVEVQAFANCPNLYKVILRNPDTIIEEGTFENSNYVTVVIEEEALDSAA